MYNLINSFDSAIHYDVSTKRSQSNNHALTITSGLSNGDSLAENNIVQLHPQQNNNTNRIVDTIAYARVSTALQIPELETQWQTLKVFCVSKGWRFEIISDIGAAVSYNMRGFKKLIDAIIEDKINRLVLTHRDGLLCLRAEILFSICKQKNVEVVILNHRY